ncbi:FKBP12-associated protein, partial [Coemansia sp. RSA 1694]
MTSESTADGGPAGVDDAATAAAAAVAEAKRLPRIPPPVPDKNQGSQSNRQRNNSNNNNNNNGANAASGRNKGNKNKGSLPPRAASAGGSSGPPRALSASGSTGSHRAATNANGSSGPSRAATNASGSNGSHRAAGSSSKQKGSSSSNSRAAGKPGRMARIDDADNDSDSNIGRVQYSRQRSRKSGKAGGVGGGRMFSGRLTMDDGSGGAAGDSDAMEGDLGAASNLSSVLARRLTCGDYECMICCDKVRARNAVWQCDRCWAIFHLGCVRRWAQACAADGPAAQWRCPGCQHARAAEPAHYVCFCGAQANPEPARRGAVPHACTRICGRRRGAHCPHPCAQPCHPGPCAPCTALAPEQWCFCGRVAHQPRCGAAFDPARAARSCGAPCGETLGCGRHACAQPCHAGLCAPCERTEQQPCRCGRNSRAVRCGSVP